MSLAELEASWQSATDPEHRFLALMRLPAVSLQASEIEKARNYAEKLLASVSKQQHLFTHIWADREANTVLGWCAPLQQQL